jgi:hypothetical protein
LKENRKYFSENQSNQSNFIIKYLSRAEGFDFLSEAQYLGQLNPGAPSYNPDVINQLMK